VILYFYIVKYNMPKVAFKSSRLAASRTEKIALIGSAERHDAQLTSSRAAGRVTTMGADGSKIKEHVETAAKTGALNLAGSELKKLPEKVTSGPTNLHG
jgi:hypothetical protein